MHRKTLGELWWDLRKGTTILYVEWVRGTGRCLLPT